MACAEIRAEPYLRCRPQPRGGLPADRGGRQALIRRELPDRHVEFLVIHLEPGIKAGAGPQQGEGEIVKLVRVGDDNGRGAVVRGAAGGFSAVDSEEPRPFWRLAGGDEQAPAGAAGEFFPPENVLYGGQGTAVRGLGVVKLELKYRSFDGRAGREQSGEVDAVVRLRTGQPKVRPPLHGEGSEAERVRNTSRYPARIARPWQRWDQTVSQPDACLREQRGRGTHQKRPAVHCRPHPAFLIDVE